MTFFRSRPRGHEQGHAKLLSIASSLSGSPIKNPYISLIHKDFSVFCSLFIRDLRAENETRTRDPNLGKGVLYQLSYFRKIIKRTLLLSISANLFLRAPSSPFSAGEALRFGDAKVRLKFNFTNYYEKKIAVFTDFMPKIFEG